MLTRTFFARAPLAPGRFAPLPVGAVSAQGATRDRLLALRGGLLSRCASVFPEAGEQSAWFGGPLGGGMHAPNVLEAMLLTAAGCNYFMGIPHGDDVMLNYQTTGFRETAALRELFGLTAIAPFQRWLERMGFVENGKLTARAGDGSALL